MDKLPWINILSTFIQRKKPPKYWKIYAVNKIFMRPTVALVATNIMLIWSDKDGKSENMIPSFCPLTTSNQKLSKHDARCFLSRLINHRPPFLFLSSSHIGLMPSCNKYDISIYDILRPSYKKYSTLKIEISWCPRATNIIYRYMIYWGPPTEYIQHWKSKFLDTLLQQVWYIDM